MTPQETLNSLGWTDRGSCKKCGGTKWTWTKREYEVILLGVQQTMFKLKHNGLLTGTFPIYELFDRIQYI